MKLLVKSEFFEVEVEGQTAQEVWQRAAFWHSLPTVCPVDGSPVKFGYANRGGYDFYFLESTGYLYDPKHPRYEFQFGTDLDSKQLFPGKVRGQGKDKKTVREWTYWDAANECQVVAWRDGKLLTKPEAGQVEHRNITSDADIDAALEEAYPRNQDGPDPWEMAYRVCDDLGLAIYGPGWTARSAAAAEWASGKATSALKDLTIAELQAVTTKLKVAQKNGVQVGVTA